jgi:hypothetical protein
MTALLGAVAAPLIGGAVSSIFGGQKSSGGSSSGSGGPIADIFEPEPNEKLEDIVDSAFGGLDAARNFGNSAFTTSPQRQQNALANYEDYRNNLLFGVQTGRVGPTTAGLQLQNFIQSNDLFDLDERFGDDLNAINRLYSKSVVPKQNEEQVKRAVENVLGREATGNELLKYTARFEGGVPGYDYQSLLGDLSQTQEYKDKFGTGGALDAYYDSYYGKRLTETVAVPEGEQQEYQRPSLDAIRKRYGLGDDFGGYDVLKARQAGYSDDELIDYLKQNPNYLAGDNVVGGSKDMIRELERGSLKLVDTYTGKGLVPIDRGETSDFKYQEAIGPTREVITDRREYRFAPDNFTKKARRTAGLKPIEDFTFTGTIAEIEDFQQQRRDERKYLYNSGLTTLQGDIDKSLQKIKDLGRERLAVIQGQYGMVQGLAAGLFS